VSKKRKCNDAYVRFGVTCIGETEDFEKPQCMFCEIVFANSILLFFQVCVKLI